MYISGFLYKTNKRKQNKAQLFPTYCVNDTVPRDTCVFLKEIKGNRKLITNI